MTKIKFWQKKVFFSNQGNIYSCAIQMLLWTKRRCCWWSCGIAQMLN